MSPRSYRIPVDPGAKIWQLSLGERQRVEILKALYRGARILILDEPTTVLTPQEGGAAALLSMREMAAAGGTIIFISHKLPEVTAISDRITILRKGRVISTVRTADTDAASLAEAHGWASHPTQRTTAGRRGGLRHRRRPGPGPGRTCLLRATWVSKRSAPCSLVIQSRRDPWYCRGRGQR